jgi:adenosylhomocysteine nucleosidase
LTFSRPRLIRALACTGFLASSLSFADTAILVALPAEQSALSREVRIVGQSVELAQHRVSIGYHKGEKLYIVRTGAGNLNSAMVTQALLTRYKVDQVISIGVAGNLKDEWHVGDLLIVTNVVNHQEGTETAGGFEAKENSESRIREPEGYRTKCEALRSNAVEIARTLLERPQAGTPAPPGNDGKRDARPTNVHVGRLVSGESFIASTAKRKWLRETFHADAVDMVSAGITRVCEANGVPCVIIRILSDNADESASAAFTRFVQSGKAKDPITVPIAIRLVEQVAPAHP